MSSRWAPVCLFLATSYLLLAATCCSPLSTALAKPNNQSYPIAILKEEQVLNLQHFKDEITNLQTKLDEKIPLDLGITREPKQILAWMFTSDGAQRKTILKERTRNGLRK